MLDTLGDRVMNPLRYNYMDDGKGNFYETMVVSHTVATNSAGTRSGVRWYEIRGINTGTLEIYQQGTYSPDSDNRFIPTIGMDSNNNIVLMYSLSSGSKYPSLALTGQYWSDNFGIMTIPEVIVVAGQRSQEGEYGYRWGDYFSMALDPVVRTD